MMQLLLEAAARAIALGLVAWAGLALARARNPYLQKTVWALVLVACLGMPLLMQLPAGPAIRALGPVVTLRPLAAAISPVSAWAGLLSALYCAVLLVMLGHLALGMWRMLQICRRAQRIDQPWARGWDVRATAAVAAPATFGSIILLPRGFRAWSASQVAAVMAHESAHVRALDSALLWLARLNTCMFWFNPCAWWLERRLAVLAETTSDDAAWRALGNGPAYAEILLGFAARRAGGNFVTSMARSNVSARIERIIAGTAPSAAPRLWRHLLTAAAVLPAIAAAAMLQSGPMRLAQATQPASTTSPGAYIKSWGDIAELGKYYPAEAKRRGVEGIVQIAVTLDAQGRATDTVVLYEDPPDMGFGAAASAAAHTMEYANRTGRPVQFTFNVKFALQSEVLTTDVSPASDPQK